MQKVKTQVDEPEKKHLFAKVSSAVAMVLPIAAGSVSNVYAATLPPIVKHMPTSGSISNHDMNGGNNPVYARHKNGSPIYVPVSHHTSRSGSFLVYCSQPANAAPNGNFKADSGQYRDSAKAVLCVGYPIKSAAQLGCHTNFQAYYATQLAFWTEMGRMPSSSIIWRPSAASNRGKATAAGTAIVRRAYNKILADARAFNKAGAFNTQVNLRQVGLGYHRTAGWTRERTYRVDVTDFGHPISAKIHLKFTNTNVPGGVEVAQNNKIVGKTPSAGGPVTVEANKAFTVMIPTAVASKAGKASGSQGVNKGRVKKPSVGVKTNVPAKKPVKKAPTKRTPAKKTTTKKRPVKKSRAALTTVLFANLFNTPKVHAATTPKSAPKKTTSSNSNSKSTTPAKSNTNKSGSTTISGSNWDVKFTGTSDKFYSYRTLHFSGKGHYSKGHPEQSTAQLYRVIIPETKEIHADLRANSTGTSTIPGPKPGGGTITPPPTPTHHDTTEARFDIKKLDDENQPVLDAKFDIYKADANWTKGQYVGTLTTDKNGLAHSGLEPVGSRFIAIESHTAKNLVVDPTPVKIDLTQANLSQNAQVTKTTDHDTTVENYKLTVMGPINNHRKPELTSKATNLEDGSSYIQPIKGPEVINEHLFLTHLVGSKTYNVKSWLVDKATGKEITINGKPVEATKTYGSPNTDVNDNGVDGSVDLQLKIADASSLAGKDIVVYSTAARSDKPNHYTVNHTDINDKAETIHVSKPSIGTTAVNKETGRNTLQPTDHETVTDTIDYHELIPNKRYTIRGIIMDKQSGKAVMNNGKKVEFSKDFTPTSANGKVDASVTFDAHHYYDHDLVVFETIYYKNYFLTDHRDLNAASQTLHVRHPQLHTTLSFNTQKLVAPQKDNIVEDVVRYTDLVPGTRYVVRGHLMDQVTGLPVQVHGVPVIATASFKPTQQNGTITVTFKFDGTQYRGATLVAFETLYDNGRVVAEHADLNDASQSVVIDHRKPCGVLPTCSTPQKGTPATPAKPAKQTPTTPAKQTSTPVSETPSTSAPSTSSTNYVPASKQGTLPQTGNTQGNLGKELAIVMIASVTGISMVTYIARKRVGKRY